VLAALLALSFGFTWVLWIGGALYGAAWLNRPKPHPLTPSPNKLERGKLNEG